MHTQDTILMKSCPDDQHIIHLAMNWAEALKQGLVGSCAEIGDRLELSDGRVRQIVRLSKMHPRIVDFLSSLCGEGNLKRFSDRRLRSVISVPKDQQLERFQIAFAAKIGS